MTLLMIVLETKGKRTTCILNISIMNLKFLTSFEQKFKYIIENSYGSMFWVLYEWVNRSDCKFLQFTHLLRMTCLSFSGKPLVMTLSLLCELILFVRHWRLREECRSCKWVLLCRKKVISQSECYKWVEYGWLSTVCRCCLLPTDNFLSWTK